MHKIIGVEAGIFQETRSNYERRTLCCKAIIFYIALELGDQA